MKDEIQQVQQLCTTQICLRLTFYYFLNEKSDVSFEGVEDIKKQNKSKQNYNSIGISEGVPIWEKPSEMNLLNGKGYNLETKNVSFIVGLYLYKYRFSLDTFWTYLVCLQCSNLKKNHAFVLFCLERNFWKQYYNYCSCLLFHVDFLNFICVYSWFFFLRSL